MRRSERGAAAVEFALVLPVLVLLVFAIIEFGRAYHTQLTLTAAAREGVRVMAIQNNEYLATTATIDAAPSLTPALAAGQVQVTPTTCTPGDPVTVTATYPVSFVTSFFGTGVTLTGTGVMRCGG